jgi:hypothetical protein
MMRNRRDDIATSFETLGLAARLRLLATGVATAIAA